MDLTPEFAQHVIDSASKYKAAELEFRKCLTIEIDCSKAIDTSIGKIPIIGNGAAIRIIAKLAEAVKLLETMTIYYL
jgi:hypothetical protein